VSLRGISRRLGGSLVEGICRLGLFRRGIFRVRIGIWVGRVGLASRRGIRENKEIKRNREIKKNRSKFCKKINIDKDNVSRKKKENKRNYYKNKNRNNFKNKNSNKEKTSERSVKYRPSYQ
jgi:hypothetical protein